MTDIDQNAAEPAKESKRETWIRGLIMLAFVIFFGLAETLLHLMALVQFLWLLITGARNDVLMRFGKSMALWMADVARFQTCATEDKPFPWRAWPSAD